MVSVTNYFGSFLNKIISILFFPYNFFFSFDFCYFFVSSQNYLLTNLFLMMDLALSLVSFSPAFHSLSLSFCALSLSFCPLVLFLILHFPHPKVLNRESPVHHISRRAVVQHYKFKTIFGGLGRNVHLETTISLES